MRLGTTDPFRLRRWTPVVCKNGREIQVQGNCHANPWIRSAPVHIDFQKEREVNFTSPKKTVCCFLFVELVLVFDKFKVLLVEV